MRHHIKHIVERFTGRNKKIHKTDKFNTADFLQTLSYPTPYFLFSKERVLNNYKDYKKYFPNPLIQYAMKANSEKEILEALLHEGSGFEVASIYELEMLRRIRVPADRVVFGTSVKPAHHIKQSFDHGVKIFAADSFPELEKIAANAPGSKVYIRSLANDASSVFKFSEKFGTDPATIIPLLVKAKELGLQPYGISFHVGSQASDPKAWANVLVILRAIIEDLQDMGIKLEVLNLGGGYPCKYTASENIPTLKEIAKYTLQQYDRLKHKPQLMLEPGRGMVADSGVLVASVIARVERRGNTWLFLDAGCYNGFFEAMAYQGSTRYPVNSLRPAGNAGEALFELAGPTGDSPDVMTREALLPADTEVGDKLVFHNIGAYSLVTASPFNGFPRPAVYYIDNLI